MGKGRAPCCDKSKVKRGPWCPDEDSRLISFIQKHGCSNWRALPKHAGLLRCGKSCRLRWINYLRPDVKRGNFTPEEEQIIINLHNSIGNKWSKIASYLPGRTDNEIKNVWNTHLKKKLAKKILENRQKTEADDAKTDYYSGSPSCTSSSITTFEDQKTEKTPDVHGMVQQSRIKKPESLIIKETPSSDSPLSSYESNISNSNQDSASGPNLEPIFFMSEDTNQGNHQDDGNGVIPFDSDIDFWELWDHLDPLQSTQTEQNAVNKASSLFSSVEKVDSTEVEYNSWLRFLEIELGLTTDNLQKDQEMNFEPEINPAMDYFPIWHDLPQKLPNF